MRPAVWSALFCFAAFQNCQCSVDELRVQSAFAIQNGLDFVAANQTATGGFITDCWQADAPEHKTPVDAVFTVSQVLYSLSYCHESASARGTEERAVNYLAGQRDSSDVWHYYGSGTDIKMSADVDDTSVTWAALQRVGVPTPPAALDAVRASRDEKGLFTTWIGLPSSWVNIDSRDIDTVVNINALLLLGLAHENVDTVCKYVVDVRACLLARISGRKCEMSGLRGWETS